MTLVTTLPLVEMDGRRLYYTFIAGARKVIEHQVELNKINVFPVNDGDTGTNLASTIRAVIDSLHPHKSYKITADRIAETSLVNARGNSGIIFAQFLYGMSIETGNFKTITIAQFAESIKNSIRYIYEAIANPVEGTMLTVIREWADYIYDNRHRFTDFNDLFLGSVNILNKSLIETKSKLEVLKKANVVDAGSDRMKRLHVHTNTPADLFNELRKTGTIAFQKADDMIRQSDVVYNRKWKIALVTDSTCDLAQELIDRYQINMLPININFGENHYLDKVTIQPEQFYSLLEENIDYPKSAQVNEKAFINIYSHLASHYDSVIAIHLSDKLSGTFGSSQKAARAISKEFNKPISVINSKNLSGALGLIVLRAAMAIEAGHLHDKVVEFTETWVKSVKILVSVRDIKYLIRGGRLSATKGLIARLLNVNPIVSIDNSGKAIVFGKSFNQKANMEKVIANITDLIRGKSVWNYIVLHANNPDAAKWYSDKMEEITLRKPVSVVNISPVIGANTGIGAAAVAFLPE